MAKRKQETVGAELDYTFASTMKPGSDEHAALLGLIRAEKDYDLQFEGWRLADETAHGPNVTDRYLMNILKQHVGELTAEIVLPQSDDRHAPNYAPPAWRPKAM